MEKLIIPSILSATDATVLTEQVLKATAPLVSSDEKLQRLYNLLYPIYERFIKNLKSSLKSEFTEQKVNLDRTRDLASMSFREIVHGMSILPIPEINVKARKLYASIEKIGSQVYTMSYSAETALLKSLFKELDQDEYQTIITELGLQRNYEFLKESQAAFEDVCDQKNAEKVTRFTENEPATDIMKELLPALIKLVSMIQLYKETDPETYTEPFNQIVGYITDTNAAARAAITRKENGTGGTTTPEPKK